MNKQKIEEFIDGLFQHPISDESRVGHLLSFAYRTLDKIPELLSGDNQETVNNLLKAMTQGCWYMKDKLRSQGSSDEDLQERLLSTVKDITSARKFAFRVAREHPSTYWHVFATAVAAANGDYEKAAALEAARQEELEYFENRPFADR